MNPSLGYVQEHCSNLYWLTSQPYVTGQELTGNQCIQPPFQHQYSVSLSCHKAAHLAVLPPPVSLSFSLCLCNVLLWKPQHLYFKDFFCFSALYSNDQTHTGRGIQLKKTSNTVGWAVASRLLESGFSLTRSLRGDDSWRNASLIPLTLVMWPRGSVTFHSNLNGLGGQRREIIFIYVLTAVCSIPTLCFNLSVRVRKSTGLLMHLGTYGCVWPSLVASVDWTPQQQWV